MVWISMNYRQRIYYNVCVWDKCTLLWSKLSFGNIIDYCFSFVFMFCVSLDNEIKYLVAWLFLLCFIPLYTSSLLLLPTHWNIYRSASPFSIDYLWNYLSLETVYIYTSSERTVLCGANAIFCSFMFFTVFFFFWCCRRCVLYICYVIKCNDNIEKRDASWHFCPNEALSILNFE